jgi:hypothetical protein
VDETWDDYDIEAPHTHSAFDLKLGQVFFRDVRPDTGRDGPLYMRFRTAPVILAAICWFAVAVSALFVAIQDGGASWFMIIALAAWAVGIINFWWFDYVRIDGATIRRSHLFGLIRHDRRIDELREVRSLPLKARGMARRTPSIRFVFPDRWIEVRAAAYHWVDGRKLMLRLYRRGVPIAPKLVRHFELDEAPERKPATTPT